MHRRPLKLALLGVALALLYFGTYTASLLCGEADYHRALQGKAPAYSWFAGALTDGGTTGYQGIGYTLERIHSFHGDPQQDGQGHVHSLYDSGTRLRYELKWLFPFDRRSDRRQTEITDK